MNQKERVICALELKQPDRIPVLEWSVDERIRKKIIKNSTILDIVEYLDLDGLTLKPNFKKKNIKEDLYMDEWGCIRKNSDQFIDIIIESPIKNIKDYKKFVFPEINAEHRFKDIENAIKRFGENKAIVLNIRDIFSDLRDLLGYENALISLVQDLDYVEKFLELIMEYNTEVARVVNKKYGINILVTTDDIADNHGLIFNPNLFFNFFGPKFKRLISDLKDMGYYCIKHCDGNIMEIIEYFVSSGIDCIDPVDPTANMDIKLIKEKYGKKVCIKGNVNCTTTLVSGSLNDVENSVKYCIKNAGLNGGYILSSSNTIHSGVKVENFLKMVSSAKKYGKYPLNLHSL